LPGIGEYTAAAIASIAFGESVAVVDGNVERVILRLTGRPGEATAAARAFVRNQAQSLVPPPAPLHAPESAPAAPRPSGVWDAAERIALAATANPAAPSGGDELRPSQISRSAGEHNQAMMELGATVCLPRAPLCRQCPVNALCLTRGEHVTPPRAAQRSLPVAYLLDLRKRGTASEVLLERRASNASLMPGMFELPPLPLETTEGREPILRVRHAITNTNYYVQVFSPGRNDLDIPRKNSPKQTPGGVGPIEGRNLHWVQVSRLTSLPITGLARKILQRLHVMENPRINLLE
jgi:A/G-specific adenine glycosylase